MQNDRHRTTSFTTFLGDQHHRRDRHQSDQTHNTPNIIYTYEDNNRSHYNNNEHIYAQPSSRQRPKSSGHEYQLPSQKTHNLRTSQNFYQRQNHLITSQMENLAINDRYEDDINNYNMSQAYNSNSNYNFYLKKKSDEVENNIYETPSNNRSPDYTEPRTFSSGHQQVRQHPINSRHNQQNITERYVENSKPQGGLLFMDSSLTGKSNMHQASPTSYQPQDRNIFQFPDVNNHERMSQPKHNYRSKPKNRSRSSRRQQEPRRHEPPPPHNQEHRRYEPSPPHNQEPRRHEPPPPHNQEHRRYEPPPPPRNQEPRRYEPPPPPRNQEPKRYEPPPPPRNQEPRRYEPPPPRNQEPRRYEPPPLRNQEPRRYEPPPPPRNQEPRRYESPPPRNQEPRRYDHPPTHNQEPRNYEPPPLRNQSLIPHRESPENHNRPIPAPRRTKPKPKNLNKPDNTYLPQLPSPDYSIKRLPYVVPRPDYY